MFNLLCCCLYLFEIVAFHFTTGESTFDAQVRLEKMLLNGYFKEARPVLHPRDNVTITVGISLYLIKTMDDKDQMLTTSLWIRQIWRDHRLTWTPSNFSSVKKINIPAKKVWSPDIKVYNEINRGRYSGLDQFQTRVVVNYDGRVQWMGPTVMRTSCQVDVKMFPYDTQTCRMKIGSWTYDGYALDVQPESYTMDISKSPSNLEWELVSTSVERNVRHYPCCPEPYPDVTYAISIKRRPKSYGINFVFPALLLTALTFMAFVTSGERIGLVLTCLVSMFFFLKMIAERTPTSDTVPLLSIYYVILSLEVTLVFYAVCISLNAYYRHPALGSMSSCVRRLVVRKLGGIWCKDSITDEIQQKLESLHAMANTIKSQHENWEELRTVNDSLGMDDGAFEDKQCTNAKPHVGQSSFEVNEFEDENRNSLTNSFSSVAADETVQDQRDCSISVQPNKQCRKTCADIGESSRGTVEEQVFSNAQTRFRTDQNFQPLHCCSCNSCQTRLAKTRCSSFVNEMITLNHRLISNIQEINFLARNRDYKALQREYWIIGASILDRTFFVLFVAMFVISTLCNFIL